MMYDTIAALATPPLTGAIGVIRLSGGNAVAIAGQVFVGKNGTPLDQFLSRQLHLGHIHDASGHVLDQALAVLFRGPHSYTGEDIVELHCHGSLPVLRETLRALYEAGARPALPGEFTQRAFLLGRMDLAQAEAVIDLITAQTVDAARNAVDQLGGGVGRAIHTAWSRLIDLCAHFRALVDYPEEDIPPLPAADMIASLRTDADTLNALGATFERGKNLREGIFCVLSGKPNVGKSSLLNALLGFDRAIVTEHPGTTRDTLVESVHMGGQWLRVADTAGLRDATHDKAESLGIDRASKAARDAALVFLVLDGSQPLDEQDWAIMNRAKAQPVIVLVNKDDLPRRIDLEEIQGVFPYVCPVSALTGQGMDTLDRIVGRVLQTGDISCDGTVLTNLRHAQAVAAAAAALEAATCALMEGVTPDVVLTELEAALSALEEITGRRVSEEIITKIFERFCVGK